MTVSHSHPAARWTVAALWILQVAAAAMLVLAGTLKLLGAPDMVALFGVLGFGQWFRYFTAITELVSAALLLTPQGAAFGALLLIPTMVGAILTHVVVLHSSPAIPVLLLLVGFFIVWRRRDQVSRFVR